MSLTHKPLLRNSLSECKRSAVAGGISAMLGLCIWIMEYLTMTPDTELLSFEVLLHSFKAGISSNSHFLFLRSMNGP